MVAHILRMPGAIVLSTVEVVEEVHLPIVLMIWEAVRYLVVEEEAEVLMVALDIQEGRGVGMK